MARITKAPEQRKQEIIDTASRLFAEKGYSDTAVRDIVREMNVAQGLFYYYFKSKEDVFLAIMQQAGEAIIRKIAAIITNEAYSPLICIRESIAAISQFLTDENAFFRKMPSLPSDFFHLVFYHMTIDMLEPYLSALLSRGRDDGSFLVPDPQYISRFILAGFLGVFSGVPHPSAHEMIDMVRSLAERILGLPINSLSPSK